MKIEQIKKTSENLWVDVLKNNIGKTAQLVFMFGERNKLKEKENYNKVREFYPHAEIISCSTAGEIMETRVRDNSIVVTAIEFEKTRIKTVMENINGSLDSEAIGRRLSEQINQKGLTHAMIFTDGLKINGSDIARGVNSILPKDVAVTGGMAGDQDRFKETVVGLNENISSNNVVIIGFYGEDLEVGYGSVGGWDAFGIERLVTKSKGNILYEVDGKPVLDLYKKYLGDEAEGLPGTGLLFPLSIRTDKEKKRLVRTVLSVDEKEKSMTFAGDIPEGSYAQLMKANFERLIDGAINAAKKSQDVSGIKNPELAILISCVGRKLVLRQRIEEEIEGVKNALGDKTALTGFYSYGEISPIVEISKDCELHNQTMTITTFKENK